MIKEEMLKQALSETDEFLEHDGKVYLKFDSIVIYREEVVVPSFLRFFPKSKETKRDERLTIDFYLDGKKVNTMTCPLPLFEDGDSLNLYGFGGLLKVTMSAS